MMNIKNVETWDSVYYQSSYSQHAYKENKKL